MIRYTLLDVHRIFALCFLFFFCQERFVDTHCLLCANVVLVHDTYIDLSLKATVYSKVVLFELF